MPVFGMEQGGWWYTQGGILGMYGRVYTTHHGTRHSREATTHHGTYPPWEACTPLFASLLLFLRRLGTSLRLVIYSLPKEAGHLSAQKGFLSLREAGHLSAQRGFLSS